MRQQSNSGATSADEAKVSLPLTIDTLDAADVAFFHAWKLESENAWCRERREKDERNNKERDRERMSGQRKRG